MCSNSLRETIIGKLNRRFQILRENVRTMWLMGMIMKRVTCYPTYE